MKSLFYMLISTISLLPLAAQAQEGRPGSPEGWSLSVGAGTLISPAYLGDDAYALSVVPSVRAAYGDRFFASVEGGAGYALIQNEAFRAGPLMTIGFGRDEDGSSPFRIAGQKTRDLIGLGDIDTTVSFGGFAEYKMGRLTASVKGGQAISGHDGLTGEIGVKYSDTIRPFGPPVFLTVGPSIKYGDTDYTSAFFGVNQAQSTASGLAPYAAAGGVTSYGVSGLASLPLSKNVMGTFVVSYDRLAGDAADSPLVTLRGAADQVFSGFVLSYKLM